MDLDLRYRRHTLRQRGARGLIVPPPVAGSQGGVVVRYAGGPSTTRAHLRYLTRGKGLAGTDAPLFTRPDAAVEVARFVQAARQDAQAPDPRQFRFTLSLADASLALTPALVQAWVAQVEQDTRRTLDWVGAIHHDTGRVHAHVVVRNHDLQGQAVLFVPHYYAHGLRARWQEVATRTYGPVRSRATQDLQRAQIRQLVQAARARRREVGRTHVHG